MPWVSELNYSEKGESEHFEEGGRGLHYGKTRRPGPLFHSSGESWKTPCISNEWFYVSVLRGPTSISWIQANILCLTDCDFHSRVHQWLLQGYEGIMSVFFVFLLLVHSKFKFICYFVCLVTFYVLSWSEVTSPTWPLSGDPPLTVPHDDLPTSPGLLFSNNCTKRKLYIW